MADDIGRFVVAPARVYEALAVADTALALSGHEVPEYVHTLEFRITRGEMTTDEAVADIIARHVTGHNQYPT